MTAVDPELEQRAIAGLAHYASTVLGWKITEQEAREAIERVRYDAMRHRIRCTPVLSAPRLGPTAPPRPEGNEWHLYQEHGKYVWGREEAA